MLDQPDKKQPVIALECIQVEVWPQWLENQSPRVVSWLESTDFRVEPGRFTLLANNEGRLDRVVAVVPSTDDLWALGDLPSYLPEGRYRLTGKLSAQVLAQYALGWQLGAYRFDRYKKIDHQPAELVGDGIDGWIAVIRESSTLCWVRDLINTPAEDMGPAELAAQAKALAEWSGADYHIIVDDDLPGEGFPAVYAVGRASVQRPRLIELRWGEVTAPRVTLVGKGVCFDTGGLDLKPAKGMRLMKKDMGGAAYALGLARRIMEENLPVRLRVLIPAVENAINGKAFRPGDILATRSGLSVEVDNTDAEGRLILCDALTAAAEEGPGIVIDFATLTGAARVALGTELPALFARQDETAAALFAAGQRVQDMIWRLPLYADYRPQLDSPIADLLNCSISSCGGAITAALFLDQFLSSAVDWVHLDVMAWNERQRAGRPIGGEAMGLRAAFEYLRARYASP